jgi:hypothetical protein
MPFIVLSVVNYDIKIHFSVLTWHCLASKHKWLWSSISIYIMNISSNILGFSRKYVQDLEKWVYFYLLSKWYIQFKPFKKILRTVYEKCYEISFSLTRLKIFSNDFKIILPYALYSYTQVYHNKFISLLSKLNILQEKS